MHVGKCSDHNQRYAKPLVSRIGEPSHNEPTIMINCGVPLGKNCWVLSGLLVVKGLMSLPWKWGVMGGCWCHWQRPKNAYFKPLVSRSGEPSLNCYEGFRIERCNDLAMEARHPKETRFFCFVMRASTELKGAII